MIYLNPEIVRGLGRFLTRCASGAVSVRSVYGGTESLPSVYNSMALPDWCSMRGSGKELFRFTASRYACPGAAQHFGKISNLSSALTQFPNSCICFVIVGALRFKSFDTFLLSFYTSIKFFSSSCDSSIAAINSLQIIIIKKNIISKIRMTLIAFSLFRKQR